MTESQSAQSVMKYPSPPNKPSAASPPAVWKAYFSCYQEYCRAFDNVTKQSKPVAHTKTLPSSRTQCRCGQNFKSRNQLFKHIKIVHTRQLPIKKTVTQPTPSKTKSQKKRDMQRMAELERDIACIRANNTIGPDYAPRKIGTMPKFSVPEDKKIKLAGYQVDLSKVASLGNFEELVLPGYDQLDLVTSRDNPSKVYASRRDPLVDGLHIGKRVTFCYPLEVPETKHKNDREVMLENQTPPRYSTKNSRRTKNDIAKETRSIRYERDFIEQIGEENPDDSDDEFVDFPGYDNLSNSPPPPQPGFTAGYKPGHARRESILSRAADDELFDSE